MTTPAEHTGTYTLQDAEEDIANLQGQIAVAGIMEAAEIISPEIFGYATTTPRGPYNESFEAGTGLFTGNNCTITQSAVTASGWPTDATHSLLLTASGAGQPNAVSPLQKCQPNDPVNLQFDVYCPAALNNVFIGVQFWDDNNVLLNTVLCPDTVFTAGQVQTLSVQAISPPTQSAWYNIIVGDHNVDPVNTLIYADNLRASGNLIFSLSVNGGTDSVGNPFPAGLDMSGVNSALTGTDYLLNSQGLFFYTGNPAFGNLVAFITTQTGVDSFGNTFTPGFSIGLPGQGQIQLNPFVNNQFQVGTILQGAVNAMAQYYVPDANMMMPSMLGSLLLGSGSGTKMSSIMHSPIPAAANAQGGVILLESTNDGNTDTAVITLGTATSPDGNTMIYTPIMTLTPYAVIFYSGASATVVKTFTSGSGSIPIPSTVSQVKSEAWGGGGGGAGGTTGTGGSGGGGGGGGEYALDPAMVVTPSSSLPYAVGGGGSAGAISGNGGAGVNSTVGPDGGSTVTAHGGGGGTAGGVGGSGGSGSGNPTHHSGGNGAIGGNPGVLNGGGGGSSGGTGSAGNPGNQVSGGAAVPGGGAGGNGGGSSAGSAGTAPGGGGGGGGHSTGGSGFAGAAGKAGQVRVTYNTGVPTVGCSWNFGAQFNDQFGNVIQTGMTLNASLNDPTNATTPHVGMDTAGGLYLGNASGTAKMSNSNGAVVATDSNDGNTYGMECHVTSYPSQTITAVNPSVTNVTGASVAVGANRHYRIKYKIILGENNSTGAPQFGIACPATTGNSGIVISSDQNVAAGTRVMRDNIFTTSQTSIGTGGMITQTAKGQVVDIYVDATFSVAGTIQLQASTTTSGGSFTIQAVWVDVSVA